MARTLYDVLMISPRADRQFMTVAYRHLAKRYHPDVDASPVAAARMVELNDAYAILSDPARRSAYDQSVGLAPTGPAPGHAERSMDRDRPGPSSAPSPYGEAGPPPTSPAPGGSTLTFGRYRGWTLDQVARVDRDYLEWLSRTTMGRNYRRELDSLIKRR
jgi:curved DNA-binding protein CbpA